MKKNLIKPEEREFGFWGLFWITISIPVMSSGLFYIWGQDALENNVSGLPDIFGGIGILFIGLILLLIGVTKK